MIHERNYCRSFLLELCAVTDDISPWTDVRCTMENFISIFTTSVDGKIKTPVAVNAIISHLLVTSYRVLDVLAPPTAASKFHDTSRFMKKEAPVNGSHRHEKTVTEPKFNRND
ncbi:hypothetical protein E2C01_023400 [Portunus trituberculatus]|uniref:Uncharacterized protein n=1 Tax=Portunus trituberculatus TaxID=210409 RepID=A0A5B7E7W3_PORTR|nr:hypothetical protein [Portunus trituberculatus]